jgi:hypothetical protein
MNEEAKRFVEGEVGENCRHSQSSLYDLVAKEFPGLTDNEIYEAINAGLDG